jgi:hypothetical protein
MPASKKPARPRQRPGLVHQFLIVLAGTDPLVWRRIQVPDAYSFWDLHVAIQDAMGWLDYHLHEFRLFDEASQALVSVGIPTGEEEDDRPVVPGWEMSVARFFEAQAWHQPPALYAYDFGDDWEHMVKYEGFSSPDRASTYPRCVAGGGRCPPEDCGGVHGYQELLMILSDPDHDEHEERLAWVGGAIDPQPFDAAAVRFDDPRKRWRKAFGGRADF